MLKRKTRRILSFILFFTGAFFILNSGMNITSAILGISAEPYDNSILGTSLIFLSGIAYLFNPREVIVKDDINDYPRLSKLARKARRDKRVSRGLDHLREQLEEGNLEAGLGYSHLRGTPIDYMRDRGGARLYIMQESDGYHIIGESGKKDQRNVIEVIMDFFGD